MTYDVIVCGGGASGFFTAINIAVKNPNLRIVILEKTSKLLSKVKISGGGRCNVTNGRTKVGELVNYYPRGEKKLYDLLKNFGPGEMMAWLNSYGVQLNTEDDLRVFPSSNKSQTIIDCFMGLCDRFHIDIKTKQEISSIQKKGDIWMIKTSTGLEFETKTIVLATGSSPKAWKMIENLSYEITDTAPSLFTFNIEDPRISNLPGVAFQSAQVKVAGTKLAEVGPLLITHWGLSGPAILKLSAWGARDLKKINYKFKIIVNFNESTTYEQFKMWLLDQKSNSGAKKISNINPHGTVKRYWLNLLGYCEISPNLLVRDLSKKQLNKLTEECCQAQFDVNGKSTFKDEFVTCGGVSLKEVDLRTMESKKHPGIYFCGEVLDIDGITGGFNFQACWATAWAISESVQCRESIKV